MCTDFFLWWSSKYTKNRVISLHLLPSSASMEGSMSCHVFSDLSKLKPIQVRYDLETCFLISFCLTIYQLFVLHTCQHYNVVGICSNHTIHTQFIVQASILNNKCKIGFLQGAGTCFATWFYAMHGLVWQKTVLRAIIHGAAFCSETMNSKVTLALQDIEDEVFWNAIYFLLRVFFPALKALQYCVSSTLTMNKIYHLDKQAGDAI